MRHALRPLLATLAIAALPAPSFPAPAPAALTVDLAGDQPSSKSKDKKKAGSGSSSSSGATPGGPTSGGPASGSSTPGAPTTGTPKPSGGAVLSREWSVCGGPTVVSLLCADIRVAVDGRTTTVRVRNVSGGPVLTVGGAQSAGQWVLTTVGFDGIAEAAGTFVAGVGATSGPWLGGPGSSAAPAAWSAFDDKQFGGGVKVDLAFSNPNGVGDGIASSCAPLGSLPGGSNRLWITAVSGCDGYSVADAVANDGWFEATVQTIDSWDPNAADVSAYFKGQNGPGGASYECNVGGASPKGDCIAADEFEAQGLAARGAVVPEPRTVVLTATGLVGVLVPAARRRWRARGRIW